MKFRIITNEQTPVVMSTEIAHILIANKKNMMVKFLSFARRQHNCCGLAANQVSLNGERIMDNFFAIKIGHFWDLIICPVIIEYRGSPVIKKEGCLTWLGKTILAERYPEIKAQWFNLKGEKKESILTGFEAQIWQHEYNHLMGIKEVFE